MKILLSAEFVNSHLQTKFGKMTILAKTALPWNNSI